MELRHRSRRVVGALAAGALLPLMAVMPAGASLMPETITPTAVQVREIWNILTYISVGIFALVALLLIYVMVRFRKRPGENRQPATFTHNTALEILWTVVPAAILISVAVPTYKTMVYAETQPLDPLAIDIDVIGHQWYWEYRFPKQQKSLIATDGAKTALVVPVGKAVRLNLTASDVIHSWFVPALGFKIDTNPGRVTTAWFRADQEGTFKGQCAELCGTRHANMLITLKVVPEAEYLTWLDQQESIETETDEADEGADQVAAADPVAEMEAVMKRGKKGYDQRCATCHGAEGEGIPGAFPPLAGAEQVTGAADEMIKIVLHGASGPMKVKGQTYNGVMPAWKDVLNDKEIAAIITYERNSWGNSAGMVTPDQVKALR